MLPKTIDPILEYHTPRPQPPFPIRLTNGFRGDLYSLIRGAFLALFLFCLLGTPFFAFTFGRTYAVGLDFDNRLVLMELDPAYHAARYNGRSHLGVPFGSILNVATVHNFAGFEIGYWPYAQWTAVPSWFSTALSALLLILVWRKTRLKSRPPQSS